MEDAMNTSSSTTTGGDATAAVRDHLSNDLRMLISDAQRLLNDAARYDDAQLAKVKQRLRDEVERVGSQFADAQAAVEAKAREVARDADEAVRGHPYAAMGVAAVAGLLVGVLLARR
jgi:ElaB/YqjD/DUF883 family membrane-anchored ribosome-binding protein